MRRETIFRTPRERETKIQSAAMDDETEATKTDGRRRQLIGYGVGCWWWQRVRREFSRRGDLRRW